MMKQFIKRLSYIIGICIFLIGSISSQSEDQRTSTNLDGRKLITEKFILVRLNDDAVKIEHYKKLGQKSYAGKIKLKRDKINEMLISEFKAHFNYTKLYFFNISDSEKLFDEKDYSVLYDINGDPLEDVFEISKALYVIAPGTVIGNENNAPFEGLNLLLYDGSQIKPVEHPYNNFFKAASKLSSKGRRWDKAVMRINKYLKSIDR